MENGHVVEEGPPEQIFENSQNERTKQFLSKFYLHETVQAD